MKFRTEMVSKPLELKFGYQNHILCLGSCFANNIGARLAVRRFEPMINPFGILFNPISIKNNVLAALSQELTESLFLMRDDRAFHYDFPSPFSAENERQLGAILASTQLNFKETWPLVDRLIITFGSAWVYRHLATGKIVANCHKIPQAEFQKELLDLDCLKKEYKPFFDHLKKENARLEIVVTVSPVRHTKNGLHEDQLSKSTLLLLCDYLEKQFDFVHYFPAYELLIDDLRDYRFYKEDMIHPTEQAVDYVYDHFKQRYFSEKTQTVAELYEQLHKLESHVNMFSTAIQLEQKRKREQFLKSEINRLKIEA